MGGASFITRLSNTGVFLRGMPLQERIRSTSRGRGFETEVKPSAHAKKLVDRWRARANEHDGGAFDRILNAYGVDEHELARLVAVCPRDISGWTIFKQIPAADLTHKPLEWSRKSVFARVCDPLIALFLIQFESIAAETCARFPHIVGNDAERIFRLFVPALESRLHSLVRKACVLELNVARLRRQLCGETPEARFDDFIRMLGTEAYQFEFLSEYAVVAYHAISMAAQWLQNATNLLSRLCVDFSAYKEDIFDGNDPGEISSISWGAGDSHRGGQTVCIVTWSTGHKLVYKPHSLAVDEAFGRILDCVNATALNPELRHPRSMDRREYGWSEFIEHAECRDLKEIRRFYWRQGVFAAIFYVLGTTDLHHENLIAHGEFPVYVDCETIVNPPMVWVQGLRYPLSLLPPLVSSLDLLPHRVWGETPNQGIDMSGLGGLPGQKLSDATLVAESAGTDQMRVITGDLITTESSHLPICNGKPAEANAFSKDIIAGFQTAYHRVRECTSDIRRILMDFPEANIRLVKRPTRLYSAVLDTAYHPDYLRNANDREIFLSTALASDVSVSSAQLTSELADMDADDIPYFCTGLSTTEVHNSQNVTVGNTVASTQTVVARNLRLLSSRDLLRQLWLLNARLGIGSAPRSKLDTVVPSTRNTTRISLLSEAARGAHADIVQGAIVKLLLGNSIHSDGRRLWAVPEIPLSNDPTLFFDTNVTSLYRGLIGIGYYFMKLHAVTGSDHYKVIFENILQSVVDWHSITPVQRSDVSLFEGNVGLNLFLIAAGQHIGDRDLVESGYLGLLRTKQDLAEVQHTDVVSGLAGYILALSDVYNLTHDSRILTCEYLAARELLKRSVHVSGGIAWPDGPQDRAPPLAGFSHGAAGGSAALATAGLACASEEFVDGAWLAVEYENSLYVPEGRNWRDDRIYSQYVQDEGRPFFNTWCHGAVGIGLARTFLFPIVRNSTDENVLHQDLARVKQSNYLQVESTCLCHGTLGNLVCLLRVARGTYDKNWEAALWQSAGGVLDELSAHGPVTSYGDRYHSRLYPKNPGLMCGLAGIGLGLLYLQCRGRSECVLAGEMISRASVKFDEVGLYRSNSSSVVFPVNDRDEVTSPVP